MSIFRRHTFAHGINPAQHKELTSRLPVRRLPFAPELIIPLSQHTGAPALALVKPGQEVVRGEMIAAADGFVSVPIHAPATGIVEHIRLTSHKKQPSHINVRWLFYIRFYIFSGALTPIKRNAFAMVVRTAVISARRAPVMSGFDASKTFSAL